MHFVFDILTVSLLSSQYVFKASIIFCRSSEVSAMSTKSLAYIIKDILVVPSNGPISGIDLGKSLRKSENRMAAIASPCGVPIFETKGAERKSPA